MRLPNVNDYIRLRKAIPELSLRDGEVGVVRSTWFAPTPSYEVAFQVIGHDSETRALVLAENLELAENQMFHPDWHKAVDRGLD